MASRADTASVGGGGSGGAPTDHDEEGRSRRVSDRHPGGGHPCLHGGVYIRADGRLPRCSIWNSRTPSALVSETFPPLQFTGSCPHRRGNGVCARLEAVAPLQPEGSVGRSGRCFRCMPLLDTCSQGIPLAPCPAGRGRASARLHSTSGWRVDPVSRPSFSTLFSGPHPLQYQ